MSVDASNHRPSGSAHMLTTPASIHAQVGEILSRLCHPPYPCALAGESIRGWCCPQRLGWVAEAEVCACLRLHAVQTRPCSPPDSTPLSHDARVASHLSRLCPPPYIPDAPVGRWTPRWCSPTAWVKMAAATVSACERLTAGRTSLFLPPGSAAWPHNSRVLTHLACTHNPTDAPAG